MYPFPLEIPAFFPLDKYNLFSFYCSFTLMLLPLSLFLLHGELLQLTWIKTVPPPSN